MFLCSDCLYLCLYTYLSICLSICLSVCLLILSVYLPACLCLFLFLSLQLQPLAVYILNYETSQKSNAHFHVVSRSLFAFVPCWLKTFFFQKSHPNYPFLHPSKKKVPGKWFYKTHHTISSYKLGLACVNRYRDHVRIPCKIYSHIIIHFQKK